MYADRAPNSLCFTFSYFKFDRNHSRTKNKTRSPGFAGITADVRCACQHSAPSQDLYPTMVTQLRAVKARLVVALEQAEQVRGGDEDDRSSADSGARDRLERDERSAVVRHERDEASLCETKTRGSRGEFDGRGSVSTTMASRTGCVHTPDCQTRSSSQAGSHFRSAASAFRFDLRRGCVPTPTSTTVRSSLSSFSITTR